MNTYMLEIALPPYLTDDFIGMVSEQQMEVEQLLTEGRIKSFSLALDRSKLWVVIEAVNEGEVLKVVELFPILKKSKVHIQELAFYQRQLGEIPHFSLN